MKKRFLAATTAFVLCFTSTLTAFAGTASKTGTTSPLGSKGITTTYATISADKDKAIAKTSAGTSEYITLLTTITYQYTNLNGQISSVSNSGSGKASAGNSSSAGVRAESQHAVRGGSYWGNWSYNLVASAN